MCKYASPRDCPVIKGLRAIAPFLILWEKQRLGADLFRITQTESKIKADNVRGREILENTAYNVGKKFARR